MFQSFATSYEDDFPNPIALYVELDLWEKYLESYTECIPDIVASTLTSIPLSGFENGLVLIYIQQEIEPDTSAVITKFCAGNNRRLAFL